MECTGCGQCCLSEKCQLAILAFNDSDEICPFLIFIKPSFYRCSLVYMEEANGLPKIIREALAIGKGCTNEDKISNNKKRK